MYKPEILTAAKCLHIRGVGDVIYSGNAIVVGPKGSGKTAVMKELIADNKDRFDNGVVVLTNCRAYSAANYAQASNVAIITELPTGRLVNILTDREKRSEEPNLTEPTPLHLKPARKFSRIFFVDYSDSHAVSFPEDHCIATVTAITSDEPTLVKFSGATSLGGSEYGALLIYVTQGAIMVYQRGRDLELVLIAMVERLHSSSTALTISAPIAMPTKAVQGYLVKAPLTSVIWERVHPTVGHPAYATEKAACFDMEAAIDDDVVILPGKMAKIPLGWKVQLLPDTEMQLRGRSGLGIKHQITVVQGIGTIDEDYRGELMVGLINLSDVAFRVTPGMRVVQCKIAPTYRFPWTEGKVDTTERGEGGFGSTGLTSIPEQVAKDVAADARKRVKEMLNTICTSGMHQEAMPVARTIEEILADSSSLTAEELEDLKVRALADRLTAAFASVISSITADEVNNAYQCEVSNINDVKASLTRGVAKAIRTTLSTPPHLLKRFESVVQYDPVASCAIAQSVVDRLKSLGEPYLFGTPVKVLTDDGWKTAGEIKSEDKIKPGGDMVPVGINIETLEQEAWRRPPIVRTCDTPVGGALLLNFLLGQWRMPKVQSQGGDRAPVFPAVTGPNVILECIRDFNRKLFGEHGREGISQPAGRKEGDGYDYNISEPVPTSVTPDQNEHTGPTRELPEWAPGEKQELDSSTLPTTGLYGERMGMKISEGSGIVVGVPLPEGTGEDSDPSAPSESDSTK